MYFYRNQQILIILDEAGHKVASGDDVSRQKRRKNSRSIALVTALADLAVLAAGTFFGVILFAIPLVGIFTFLGVLTLSNEASADADLAKGEVRKAIAASFLAVYFVMVPALVFGGGALKDELVITVINAFTFIIITIVGFYFGFRGIKEVVLARKE